MAQYKDKGFPAFPLRYSFEQKKQIENNASVYNEEIITSNKTLILTFNNTDSLLKFDLTRNVPATLSDSAIITNTGKLGSNDSIFNLSFYAGNFNFAWYPNPPEINGVKPAYCISFNQTNVLYDTLHSKQVCQKDTMTSTNTRI